MSVAKVRTCSIPDAVNPQKKNVVPQKENHDSFDNVMGQAFGREPFFSFSRAGDSPAQWMQLLHALDQHRSSKIFENSRIENYTERKNCSLELSNRINSEMNGPKESLHAIKSGGITVKVPNSTSDQMQALKIPDAVVALAQAAAKANGDHEKYHPGWPLLSPVKVQLQKCDKCSREFCSSINYRRHIRLHRRSLNSDKDFPKNRDYMGAFWDKLTVDEAREIVSLMDMAIEEVSGSSIIRALTSWITKPGFASLPHTYVKAGIALLDIIQAKLSRLPISSKELFNMLDDASEKTFLCTDTAVSVQKYLFNGEDGKIALEMKNLVACISFLLEQKLVKSWLADKAEEALRCQKLLVEEEEAAQKRRVELIERKRMKKLRQKEQKLKEFDNMDNKVCSPAMVEGASGSDGTSSPRASSESDANTSEALLCLDRAAPFDSKVENDLKSHWQSDDADYNMDHENENGHDIRQPSASQCQFVNRTRPLAYNGFNLGQTISKSSAMTKHGVFKDPKALPNGHKVWTRKIKMEYLEECCNYQLDIGNRHKTVPSETSEVLIGSISVTLGDFGHSQNSLTSKTDHYEENISSNSSSKMHSGDSDMTVSNKRKNRRDVFPFETAVSSTISENRIASCGADAENVLERYEDSLVPPLNKDSQGPMLFSSKDAAAFLARRWEEAIAGDRVELLLPPETKAPNCSSSSKLWASTGTKPKLRPQSEKNCKLKYVPKQRNNV